MVVDYDKPPALRRSDALHERLLTFATDAMNPRAIPGPHADTFESLALDIARYQFDLSPGFARATTRSGSSLKNVDDFPLIPTDAFRLTRVAVHPPEFDERIFQTSGTTAQQSGWHPVRLLSTKKRLAILQAETTLFSGVSRGVVVALAPPPVPGDASSLGDLMGCLMEQFDGRALSPEPEGVAFQKDDPQRWLFPSHGVNVEGLRRAARLALHRSEPLFILSTSFALMATLEALDGVEIKTPSRTVIMLTGGFKGRATQLSERELRLAAARTLGTSDKNVIGEYGMTELNSQLFEGPQKGIYVAPPWLRVRAVRASDYQPASAGEPGLAHFIDLANIDSCLSVVTQDMVMERDGGIELLGRAERAEARGCSLPFEGLLSLSPSRETSALPRKP